MPVRDGRGTESRHIEETHVYKVYNQIAPKFSNISQKAWPNVRRFLKDLQPGSFVADIGKTKGEFGFSLCPSVCLSVKTQCA